MTKSRAAFHAEVAEVYLFPADGGPALRTTVTPDGVAALMEPDDSPLAAALRAAVERGSALLRGDAAHGRRELLLAPLAGEQGLIGGIALADREGRVTEFTTADLTLLETLANHTAVSLEHDRLEQALWELTEDRDRLEHRASHDPLTGLANRALFTQQVEAALARPDGRAVVLFLDLDDFKRVNDRFGHEVGDELLVAFTRRLRGVLRTSDLPGSAATSSPSCSTAATTSAPPASPSASSRPSTSRSSSPPPPCASPPVPASRSASTARRRPPKYCATPTSPCTTPSSRTRGASRSSTTPRRRRCCAATR